MFVHGSSGCRSKKVPKGTEYQPSHRCSSHSILPTGNNTKFALVCTHTVVLTQTKVRGWGRDAEAHPGKIPTGHFPPTMSLFHRQASEEGEEGQRMVSGWVTVEQWRIVRSRLSMTGPGMSVGIFLPSLHSNHAQECGVHRAGRLRDPANGARINSNLAVANM